jgi:acetyl-CoA acetyltransferase
MAAAVIVDAVRTPLAKGKPGGAYADIHPVDLHARVLAALIDRTGIDPAEVDDVIGGAVGQIGEQSGNTARWATLAAAAQSDARAARAWRDGLFDSQVHPVNTLVTDETIRPSTTVETLADLRLAFYDEHWAQRYPQLDWRGPGCTSTSSRSTRPSPRSSWPGSARPGQTSARSTSTVERLRSVTRSAAPAHA